MAVQSLVRLTAISEAGRFASLLLWFVLAPFAVVMFLVNLVRGWQRG